jgi:hypothetical protein
MDEEFPDPPPVVLLMLMQARGAAADYTKAGVTNPVTVRHARNRGPVRAEKPAVTLILVSDEPQPDEQDRNAWEVVREMVVDVQVDIDLAAEDSGDDPTGLRVLMKTLAVFVRSLRDPEIATWLGGMCDWIRLGALDPDDRSTPDEGRMTRALRVLYRVRSDDENVLLAAGVNG